MKPPERWLAVAGVTALSAIAVAGLCLAIYAAWLFHDMPDAADLADYRPPTATRAYAWDGTLIGEFSRERRIYVPYDAMPANLVQAFMAAEDRSFFQHGGVDPAGLTRAMIKNVFNLVQGRRLEGGSTITQQVAKNVLLTSDVTLGRKMREAILAGSLERVLTKEQILELYLNEIWLGYRSYGVGAAAYNYFGKSINDLTLAEAAYLAALPKGPQNYHPIRRKQQALERRNWILREMASLGWVSHEEARKAMAEDLKVQQAPARARYRDADYFVEEVRRRGLATMGDELLEGGYYMRTTLDPRLQTAARVALMKGLEAYDRRHGWRGARFRIDIAPGWEKSALKVARPAERAEWRHAVVTDTAGGVKVLTVENVAGELVSEDVAWANRGKGLNIGDIVFVEPGEQGGFRLRQIPAVNGALVAIEPYSGRVLAMVGGYSFSLQNFNRATQAYRQPGSAFKPIVYAAALENGYTPSSVVMDSAISLPGATPGSVWRPENYNRQYYGALTLRRGLELSRNTMTVRLAQGVGMRKVVDLAKRMDVVEDMAPVLSMSLGAGETTPFRLTAAYASFVNGGRKINPHLIELVQNREGEVILKADDRKCPRCDAGFAGDESPRIPPGGEQVLDPVTAYQITSMLEGVVLRGTAASARVLDRPVGGKTGTTNEYRSAWFVGFSPQVVVGVFVGFDDNRSLGNGETGTTAAVPIFIDFMTEAAKDWPKTEFKPPKTAKFGMVRGIREAFRPGTEPQARQPVSSAAGAARTPRGPQPYTKAWPGGRISGADNAADAVRPPPPPPPKRPADDMSGLY
ncbi:penicillin-binding protein 1A [Phenylobacterium terrae]|uniref:Penicillin-binding protein 1A n=1 Tax=Phenylobacterium terrae TaxID=2665495 RepID=A0ABW4N4V7_9CAUL